MATRDGYLGTMPRLFTGLDLPAAVQRELAELQRFLVPGARPAARDDLHITLHYVGDVSDEQCASIRHALGQVAQPSFELALQGVGCFRTGGVPRYLWAGVDTSNQLVALYNAIGAALVSLGFELEQHTYIPHVTLARLESPEGADVEGFVEQHQAFHSRFEVQRLRSLCQKRGRQRSKVSSGYVVPAERPAM